MKNKTIENLNIILFIIVFLGSIFILQTNFNDPEKNLDRFFSDNEKNFEKCSGYSTPNIKQRCFYENFYARYDKLDFFFDMNNRTHFDEWNKFQSPAIAGGDGLRGFIIIVVVSILLALISVIIFYLIAKKFQKDD